MLIKRLEEAQNQLLQSEKMASIGQLAAGVAHEINNPVGFVNSNLGALQRYVRICCSCWRPTSRPKASLAGAAAARDQAAEEGHRCRIPARRHRQPAGESLDGLQRVKSIVQDLKDFSHVDESERQWADLEAGLESTLSMVWNELKYKAEVVKEFGGIPQIECFPSQLNQVFMNLLVNASHAIEEQGTITIRTGQDDDQVWVEVQDTGKGIKPENLGADFRAFFHHQTGGQGHRAGLVAVLRHREKARRPDRGQERTGPRFGVQDGAAAMHRCWQQAASLNAAFSSALRDHLNSQPKTAKKYGYMTICLIYRIYILRY